MDAQITGIIVTFNEAHFLPETLRRLAFCDELIVVDLGSRDNCVEIAERAGATVLHHEWVSIGEQVRQFAIEHAHHDWILFSDPDLYYPENIGPRLKTLLQPSQVQVGADGVRPDDGVRPSLELALVYLPILTCFGGQPLRRGQKGGVRSYAAVINRTRVEKIQGLLHHRGLVVKPGGISLGLLRKNQEGILHLWINSISDLYAKGRRYLPMEGESRHASGKRFSWRGAALELLRSLWLDLRTAAFLDWHAVQIMVFQVWYLWNANLAWHRYELHQARRKEE